MAARLDISPSEYLADPAPEPSLSSSIAKVLIERSPAHARHLHPRLGGASSAPTAATDMGSLIHRHLLGKGAAVQVVHAADFRTKAAKEERDRARLLGCIPVLESVAREATAASNAIRAELEARGIVLDGESEVPLMWQEAAGNGAIWCRAMLDHVVERDGMLHVYDIKTIQSAHPDACVRSTISYSYDIQAHAYTRAAEMCWPDYAGRVAFSFLFVEPEPSHGVLVAQLDSLMRERGRRRWERAVETWSQCLHTDTWPAYPREPVTLESPGWLLAQETAAE